MITATFAYTVVLPFIVVLLAWGFAEMTDTASGRSVGAMLMAQEKHERVVSVAVDAWTLDGDSRVMVDCPIFGLQSRKENGLAQESRHWRAMADTLAIENAIEQWTLDTTSDLEKSDFEEWRSVLPAEAFFLGFLTPNTH